MPRQFAPVLSRDIDRDTAQETERLSILNQGP
jgi:hypothetical protein